MRVAVLVQDPPGVDRRELFCFPHAFWGDGGWCTGAKAAAALVFVYKKILVAFDGFKSVPLLRPAIASIFFSQDGS